MDKENILLKLSKIREIAERSNSSNERNTAEKMLEKLMRRYSISLEDLDQESLSEFYIRYKNPYEKHLIVQIVAKVIDDKPERRVYHYLNRRHKRIYVLSTKSEELEIRYLVSVYCNELSEYLRIATKSFIHRNQIYPEHPSVDSCPVEHDESFNKILEMSNISPFVQVRKAIEDGEDNANG